MIDKDKKEDGLVFLLILVVWVFAMVLSGCGINWATKVMNKHGFIAAEYCNNAFPSDSFFLPGKTKIDTQMLIKRIHSIDTINNTYSDTVIVNKIITHIIHDTIGIIDNSAEKAIRGKYLNVLQDKAKLKGQHKSDMDKIDELQDSKRLFIVLFSATCAIILGWIAIKLKIL